MDQLSDTEKEIVRLFKELKKAQQTIERLTAMENRSVDRARKKRAHRLITKGALLEKYFDARNLSADETEELLKMFSQYVNANKPAKYKDRGENKHEQHSRHQ